MIKETNPLDFIHDGEPPGILISLELYLGIISACLPFLSPPIGKLRISIVESGFMGYIGSFTSLGGSRGTKHTSSDIQNQASWELGNRSDHSHERLTQSHVITIKDDPSLGKQADVFTMNTWPETNGYGRHYKVEHNTDQNLVDRDTLKGITLTNEWEVRVGENYV